MKSKLNISPENSFLNGILQSEAFLLFSIFKRDSRIIKYYMPYVPINWTIWIKWKISRNIYFPKTETEEIRESK